jgi:hypothetical protein
MKAVLDFEIDDLQTEGIQQEILDKVERIAVVQI